MIFSYKKIFTLNLKKISNIVEYNKYKNNYVLIQNQFIRKFVDNISDEFIDIVTKDTKNNIICFNLDNCINEHNITSVIIYRKVYLINEIKYIILLMGSHPDIRECGYGKIFLDEFISLILKNKLNKKISIILHSLNSSYNFYKNYGFTKINKSSFLKNYEGWKSNDDKLILEYII